PGQRPHLRGRQRARRLRRRRHRADVERRPDHGDALGDHRLHGRAVRRAVAAGAGPERAGAGRRPGAGHLLHRAGGRQPGGHRAAHPVDALRPRRPRRAPAIMRAAARIGVVGRWAAALFVVIFAPALLLAMVAALRAVHSDFGLVLRAVRDHEVHCRYLGLDTPLIKTAIFTACNGVSAHAGGLHALLTTVVAPSLVGIVLTTNVLI